MARTGRYGVATKIASTIATRPEIFLFRREDYKFLVASRRRATLAILRRLVGACRHVGRGAPRPAPMLDKLIDFAVHRRAITLTAAFLFAIFGVITFGKLKIEAFPDVTNVQVMVITLYPGQAAEEIEKQVTIPVERALTGTPRVLIQRSITSFGLSQVILTFEDDVDIYWARQQVAERLSDAEVPEGITPHLGPNDTPVGQVYQYTLESDHHSPSELRSWQDWVVSKNLMRAPGVADVVSFGGFQKE